MCKFKETFYIHCTAPWDIMEAKRDENVNAFQGHYHRETQGAMGFPGFRSYAVNHATSAHEVAWCYHNIIWDSLNFFLW